MHDLAWSLQYGCAPVLNSCKSAAGTGNSNGNGNGNSTGAAQHQGSGSNQQGPSASPGSNGSISPSAASSAQQAVSTREATIESHILARVALVCQPAALKVCHNHLKLLEERAHRLRDLSEAGVHVEQKISGKAGSMATACMLLPPSQCLAGHSLTALQAGLWWEHQSALLHAKQPPGA